MSGCPAKKTAPPAIRTHRVDLTPPEGMPTSCWDPALQRPDIIARVGLMAYSRVSHLPFEHGPLRDQMITWKRREMEIAYVTFGRAEKIEALDRSVRAATIGEVFKKYNYGPRGQVCFHAQWVSIGFDSRGAYFVDATLGQVFGSQPTEIGLQVRLTAGSSIIGGVTWEGTVRPHGNEPVRMLGFDERIASTFGQIETAIVELRTDCKGP